MNLGHVHPGHIGGAGPIGLVAALAAVLGATVYLLAAHHLRRRGDLWPGWRDASFCTGSSGVVAAAVAPLPGGPLTTHMMQHLIVGMAAPLLFVLARPLTLALRVTAPGTARRGLLALARSRPVGWLAFPPVAALLDLGGLWLLYRTQLFATVQHDPWLHALVYAHVLAAGLLCTFALCQLDPVRHHWGLGVREATLLTAGAAHAVLAKAVYAAPPPGTVFAPADLHTGAQVMYYGGDLVEGAVATVVAASWYRAAGRARQRRRRQPAPAPAPTPRTVEAPTGP
ncbi:cytochrome c oxidase assembly protein [Streptomyces sp. NPDC048349]|uniref:cytochrome c oxidase assembly protein n=1 Tax=Streptomyces sp. NPDC048349 TaxID=3155486 RepID=UPI0034146449